jgi:hypothetical protein
MTSRLCVYDDDSLSPQTGNDSAKIYILALGYLLCTDAQAHTEGSHSR